MKKKIEHSKLLKNAEVTKLVKKYNALSPMMKIMFSSDAQLRNAVDGSLSPILEDLEKADQLVNFLLKLQIKNSSQARSLVVNAVNDEKRRDKILNYAINALAIGDSIVFRMAYAHGQLHPSMKDFAVVHPILTDAEDLQRQISFLKRMDKTPFNMKNPLHSKYYKEWAASTPKGKEFNQTRENYTLAMSDILKEMGIAFRRIPLPHIGIGRAYIKEVVRERS